MIPLIFFKYVTKIKWGQGTYKLNNSILNLKYVQDEIYNIFQVHKHNILQVKFP